MGTLGKILLFVNLLAAAGVAYFAAQDWSKRQDVAAAALRYRLVLKGIPVDGGAAPATEDSIPFPVETAGGFTQDTVSPKFLQAYFQGADGGSAFGDPSKPPASQLKEIDRVADKVRATLDGLAPAEQLATLCGRVVTDPTTRQQVFQPGWLVRMAEYFDEREYLRQLAFSPAERVPDAAKTAREVLDKRFQAVKAAPNARLADEEAAKIKDVTENLKKAGQAATLAEQGLIANPTDAAAQKAAFDARVGVINAYGELKKVMTDLGTAASRSEPDRKKRIAHLLGHLDPSAPWQKRVALVTGLQVYHDAIADQVTRLREMSLAVQQQRVLDQASFSEEYELLKTMAIQESLLLDRQLQITADLTLQRTRDVESAKHRLAQLTGRRMYLDEIQKQVGEALTNQAKVEADLFTVESKVAETFRKNFELETKLEAAETRAATGR